METRRERYKRLRREKFIRKFKFILIIILIWSMSYGLYFVNNTIKDFDVIENDNLVGLDLNNNTIIFLGKSYYIDFQTLQNVFKD